MEETIKEFLRAWQKQNYSKMYDLCQITWKSKHNRSKLKSMLHKRIVGFEIQSIDVNPNVPTVADISVKVKISGKVKHLTIRMIQEVGVRMSSVKGTWGVNPISALKNLYV